MKNLLRLLIISVFSPLLSFAQSGMVINEVSYNPITPGFGGLEYLELFNNGSTPVTMTNWRFVQTAANGMEMTFPAVTVNPGEYLVVSNDSVGYQALYNLPAYQYTGFILNGGYTLVLEDDLGNIIDSLTYDNALPWPITAAGEGASIELCDPNTDNSQASNWLRATAHSGQVYNGRKLYGTPGAQNSVCSSSPLIHMRFRSTTVNEGDGTVSFSVYLENANGSPTSVSVKAMSGTGDIATDIMFTNPTNMTWNANGEGFFSVDIVDDTLQEPAETIWFILENPSNGILLNDTMEVTIDVDNNDVPVDRHMKLVGIANKGGNPPVPNLVEVMVIEDIPDMSIYALGCANNGGGTDGIEFTFPAQSASKGETFFVTRQPNEFNSFFGFAPDFYDTLPTGGGSGNTTALNFTGDDAMELFENGRKIDAYGDPDVDGTGEVWEYLDGWAKRKDGTGPDGLTFVASNWTISGLGALDGFSTNDSCTNPYPLPRDTTSVQTFQANGLSVKIYPSPAQDFVRITGYDYAQKIVLLDVLGNVIYETEDVTEEELEIDLTEHEAGIYLIHIVGDANRSASMRFVKQ